MGIWDVLADMADAVKPWSEAEAEAPAAEKPEVIYPPPEDDGIALRRA